MAAFSSRRSPWIFHGPARCRRYRPSRPSAGPAIVRYSPPIFAPFGVARAQACVMTRSPALSSSAHTGAPSEHANRAQAIAAKASFLICIVASFFGVSAHEVSGGMQRTEDADHGEDREPQRNLDQRIARQNAKRILPHSLQLNRRP